MLDGFLRQEDLCFTLMNEIAPKIKLEDFEEMYKEGGRPPISPKVLLLVLIMQFIERLSDRAAADNLRFRIDWKIFLDLELDFRGIHATTLVKFRERLLKNDIATYAFDKVIEHLVESGFVKQGSKQRIDSTHIIGKVRELSRLELFHETLRLCCVDVVHLFSEMPKIELQLAEYYFEEISIRGVSEAQKKKFIREAGTAMRVLSEWANLDADIAGLKSFQTMKKIFSQNFKDADPDPDGPELIEVATGKDHVSSPHEPEARFANKGGKGWLGYKAQIAETVDNECGVNFITHADINNATDHDGFEIKNYIENQIDLGTAPAKVYGDTHYNSAKNIGDLSSIGIELQGPVVPLKSIKKPENEGFEVDIESNKTKCLAGKVAEKNHLIEGGAKMKSRFSSSDCVECPRRDICKPQIRGKQVELRIPNRHLKLRREQMETEEFKNDMNSRNGIEGTLSGLVRGQGLRNCRFRGKNKTRLQIKFSASAANIKRLHRKRLMEAKEYNENAA